MDTYNRIEYNIVKGIFIIALFIILSTISCLSQAQSINNKFYKGFSATYGVRSGLIISDIPEINKIELLQEGGTAGLVFGNDIILTRVNVLGFYYNTARVPQTINAFAMEALVNYYPLNAMGWGSQSRLNPYVTGGVTQNFFRFFGHYMDNQDRVVNYSTLDQPLVGTISQTSATVGFGMEWRITQASTFINLFAEVRGGMPVLIRSNSALSNTSIKDFTGIQLGISFGGFH